MAGRRLSLMSDFVDSQNGLTIFMGIDVHKATYSVTLIRSDGLCHSFVCPGKPDSLLQTLSPMKDRISVAAQEAGPTGFPLARALEEAGIRTIVAAPSRIPRAVTPGAKNDRLDSHKLAVLAAKGFLKSIAIPTVDEEGNRSLIRRRHDLAENRRRVRQRIKSLLLTCGIDEPKGLAHWSKAGVETLKSISMPGRFKDTLDSMLREMCFYCEEMAAIEKELEDLSKQTGHDQAMACLQSVPGVGRIVAATYHLEMFRPERFDRSEEVASYLGLAPFVHQSGASSGRARLHPVGQTRLRSLLVEAAWAWKSKDASAEAMFRRLLGRHGLATKAITALARKLGTLLWRLILENRHYELRVS